MCCIINRFKTVELSTKKSSETIVCVLTEVKGAGTKLQLEFELITQVAG
jgi:hypothetical protein